MFVLNNGYQLIDQGARTSITTKVKGIALSSPIKDRAGKRIWDTADLYSHPVGDGTFFITTNIIYTPNQTPGICPEAEHRTTNCNSSDTSNCLPVGKPFHMGHGISTGICNTTTNTCMVEAWCPIENDANPTDGKYGVLQYTKDFTVFIKDHIHFPVYKTTRSNVIEDIDIGDLAHCNYHPQGDPYCPIFRIGDIVKFATNKQKERGEMDADNENSFEEMAVNGAVISISIIWDCNLDYSEKRCKPKYDFSRLDNYGGNTLARGYNFRYAYNTLADGTEVRRLYKTFGILFLVKTEAIARAFHLRTFLINIGSSLAVLSIASVVAHLCLLHLHKSRKKFKKRIVEPNVDLWTVMRRSSGWTPPTTNEMDDAPKNYAYVEYSLDKERCFV